MKILHINNFNPPIGSNTFGDYQNDFVFHGGRSLFGEDYIDSSKATYLLKTFDSTTGGLYGNGFGFTRRLDDIEIDRENILEKIRDRYFDFVIFGSIHRDQTYLSEVLKSYPSNKIVFIDGEDHTDMILWGLTEKGIYFKRELIYDNKNLHPIGFGVPEDIIVDEEFTKNKLVSNLSMYEIGYSYNVNQEDEYYNEFKRSFFARTMRKAGWDSFRNYEIVASGALPLFKNYQDIPPLTMVHWDKNLLKESYDLFWRFDLSGENESFFPNIDDYKSIRKEFLKMTKERLSTKSIFNNILEKL
jgi:hypothetical protein